MPAIPVFQLRQFNMAWFQPSLDEATICHTAFITTYRLSLALDASCYLPDFVGSLHRILYLAVRVFLE